MKTPTASPEPPVTTPPIGSEGVAWRFALRWRRRLLDAWDPPAAWLAEGRAEIVKRGPDRTVYRIDAGERSFFLKHVRPQGWLQLARGLFHGSAARREYRQAVRAARRRLPTARLVALGEQRRRGLVRESYLVTEAIPRSTSLEEYFTSELPRLPRERQTRQRRSILRALARLTAAMHEAGLRHHDFHLGNILIQHDAARQSQTTPAGDPRLFLIDLLDARFAGPLDWPSTRDSLAMLGVGLLDRASRVERRRFWTAYRQARPRLSVGDDRQAVEEIEHAARAALARVLRRRDKRALGTNRDFCRLRLARATVHAVRDVAVSDLVALADDVARSTGDPPQAGMSATFLRVGDENIPIRWERSPAPRGWRRMAAFGFDGRSALRAWRLANALRARGVATPRPLACFVIQTGRFGRIDRLVREQRDDLESLDQFALLLDSAPADVRRAEMLGAAESLGRLWGRMHAWGVSFSKPSTQAMALVISDGCMEAQLVDLASVKLRRRLSRPARAAQLIACHKSLQALSPPRKAVLRFLQAYKKEFAAQSLSPPPRTAKLGRRLAALPRMILPRR